VLRKKERCAQEENKNPWLACPIGSSFVCTHEYRMWWIWSLHVILKHMKWVPHSFSSMFKALKPSLFSSYPTALLVALSPSCEGAFLPHCLNKSHSDLFLFLYVHQKAAYEYTWTALLFLSFFLREAHFFFRYAISHTPLSNHLHNDQKNTGKRS